MQGKFKPKHPEKYKGDVANIIYRSSYELKAFIYFDKHPDIDYWSSEELSVPYRSPLDNRIHMYFPDILIKKRDGKTILIEIKPMYQVKEPEKKTKPDKKYVRQVTTWAVNNAKWNAAKAYCEDRNWEFQILTEQQLF